MLSPSIDNPHGPSCPSSWRQAFLAVVARKADPVNGQSIFWTPKCPDAADKAFSASSELGLVSPAKQLRLLNRTSNPGFLISVEGGITMIAEADKIAAKARSLRWSVVLAAGDGKRLLSLSRILSGDERPKPFCAIIGKTTLLEQTLDRASRFISPEKTLVVVTRDHEPFFRKLIEDGNRSQLLLQPSNKGTTPAILYSLMRIQAMDASAPVVF
jgi:hypothetical protein